MQQFEIEGDNSRQKIAKNVLSQAYNEYAWLVGNTEGNLAQALEYSHKSLELWPNYGVYLDTLAHCYFARGDYAEAVRYQRQAVAADPHSGQIARALQRFEQAWEESKKPNAGAGN
jgi:tetratricopeptide (TPR) repeat protein